MSASRREAPSPVAPPRYEPMLAVRWEQLFEDAEWRYEIKWDGVRTILTWDGRAVATRSRRGNDTTSTYPELHGFEAERPLILDGEIVALDDAGRPSFERLQSRMNVRNADRVGALATSVPVSLVVFDILYDGVPVIDEPWESRRDRLEQLALPSPCVVSAVTGPDPEPLWEFVRQRDLEGVVAKRLGSPYRPGTRSPDWRKIGAWRTVRAVVGGFTPGEGGRSDAFAGLQMGLWDGDRLRWIGSVGTGFSHADLAAIRGALDEMAVATPPFWLSSELPRGVVWVAPTLVALVRFKEWTAAGKLRAPSFVGFTDDAADRITWGDEGPDSPG